VSAYERKDEALQVLYEVVKDTKAVRVLAVLYLEHGAQFGAGERDVLPVHHDLQLLSPDTVRRWPVVVVLLEDLSRCKP
jgi:hypothetical protein